MTIRSVDKNEKDIIANVVSIHLDTFKGFFLTFLGKGFLVKMYASYCEHNSSNLLVAFENEKPIGFLAYSSNMSDLYKFMIRKHLFGFGWFALGAFFRKPTVFIRLIRAFLKPSESKRGEKYVELSSIGVRSTDKSKGVGSALIDSLKERVDFSNISYISLETDAENNEIANRFYVKNGFILERSYETHEGRKMNEYRFERNIQ